MAGKKTKTSSEQSPPSEGWPQAGVGENINILTTIETFPIKSINKPYLPADKNLRLRARALRKMGNLPEIVFWQQVHKRKFYNIDFDRQRVIGRYIVDFYVKGLGLVIEIDGASHNEKIQYDERRETYFKKLGLQVWKISSTEIMMDVERVMENLKNFIVGHYS
ncbi:endonuclease domain-containing protein [Salinimicrobium terrae]|uniref:endonuclease domain-containing protein n=1 Tax=Salinimicrobium terrae TaxID=470866 RepID=UPI001B7FE1D9|nr:endonuclease domain-containing protein [Salinimicrobium terrae]